MLTPKQPSETLPLTKVWEPQCFSSPKSNCAPPKGSCQELVIPPCWHTLRPLSPTSAIYSILTRLWRLLGYPTSLGQASVLDRLSHYLCQPSQVLGLGWFSRLQPFDVSSFQAGEPPRTSLPDSQPHLVFPWNSPLSHSDY